MHCNKKQMELLLPLLSSIICFFFLLHALDRYRRRRLPPGPLGLPIIGNLLDLGPKPHKSLANLANKYGPLITIRLGGITTVVASTPDAARDILQRYDEACSGRPVPHAVTALKNHDKAVLWLPTNETWQAIRKVLKLYLTSQHKLDTLKDIRENVVEGVVDFLRVSGQKKVAVDIGELAFAASLNEFSQTICSQNMTSYEHDDIKGFKMIVETAMEVLGKFNIADIFPVLKPLDPQNVWRHAKESFGWLEEKAEGWVNERIKHREAKLPKVGDMLDSMLDFSHHNEACFNVEHIKTLLVEVLIAGTDTIATSITWLMSELLLNPDIFLKVREEVSHIVGEDGKIKEAKTLNLPYLHAVIKETMRLHAGSPLLAPHVTQTEVKVGKYVLPKNTQILVNAWGIGRDPTYWKKPTVFMPERFLKDKKIDFKGQHFEFIPFGSGRRMCPGMPLAERMLSLMVASFVYYFDWELPYAKEEIDMNHIYGLTLIKATPLVATPIPIN